uniref:UBC core domain-containing protein n=1 Tax=Parascaris univalens TaxID=6257 RepID=A0A915CIU5_PARUN
MRDKIGEIGEVTISVANFLRQLGRQICSAVDFYSLMRCSLASCIYLFRMRNFRWIL